MSRGVVQPATGLSQSPQPVLQRGRQIRAAQDVPVAFCVEQRIRAAAAMIRIGRESDLAAVQVARVAVAELRAAARYTRTRGAGVGAVGRLTHDAAGAAVVFVDQPVCFTPVDIRLVVAVGVAGGAALEPAAAADARSARVKRPVHAITAHSTAAAAAAVELVGVRVRFAIELVTVAVAPGRSARADSTDACFTPGRGIGDGTGVVAATTVGQVTAGRGLAAVHVTLGRAGVAVGETRVAGRHPANRIAALRGSVCGKAQVSASAAVALVASQVDLAAVVRIAVAVAEAGRTAAHTAAALHAPRCPIAGLTDLAAGSAVVHVAADVFFTTVRAVVVAVGESLGARDRAETAGAARRAVERAADRAASSAVCRFAAGVHFAAIFRLPITVCVGRRARSDHASPARATGDRVRQVTSCAAAVAVLGGGLQIGFAAVRGVTVTVAFALDANGAARSADARSARTVVRGPAGLAGEALRAPFPPQSTPVSLAIEHIVVTGRLSTAEPAAHTLLSTVPGQRTRLPGRTRLTAASAAIEPGFVTAHRAV